MAHPATAIHLIAGAFRRAGARWAAGPPDGAARLLSAGTVALLAIVPGAVARGHARRGEATLAPADRPVRAAAMMASAALGFPVRVTHAAISASSTSWRVMRGIVTGVLLIAGFFTLPFGPMLYVWLIG